MAHVLALDVGTSSVRGALVDESGVADSVKQVRYEPGAELDAERLRDASREAGGGREPDGVSCFWHGLLALDRRGRPLTPISTWLDVRADEQARQLAQRLDASAVHRRTGCRLHPSYWPAKLLWLRAEQPDAFRAARRFVSFSDYLLGGGTSLSMASGTGLLDLERLAWDNELLDAVGVEPERLPAIEDPPAWGDGACANVGSGSVEPDRACLTIGTSTAYRLVGEAPYRPELFRYLLDAARPVVGGALSDGGNVYSWLERTLRLDPRDTVSLAGGRDAATASALRDTVSLAKRPAAGHGLAFLPQLGGERSPGWNVRATGALAGLRLETTPLDVLQAALEGIAYRVAEVADALPPAREVVATGGALLADDDWEQILADVLERPVVIGVLEEASLRGAAVLAFERRGVAVPPPRVARVVEPRPERFEAHREARARQRELYDALQRPG